MKKVFLTLLVLNLLSCNQQQVQSLPDSPAVAYVGDEKITLDLFNAFLQANGINNPDDALLAKALESLTEEVAIANLAKNKEESLTTQQLNTLEYLRIKTLANNVKQDFLSNKAISEKEIQAEYEQAQQQVGGSQYHIHHLLYNDEIEAIKNLDEINSIDDYKMLALLYKQQNPNRNNVGDIGWLSLSQLPKGFREPLLKAKENSVLKQIINSQFGAHIVYFEEQRALKPPNLEVVREGIIKSLKAKKLSKFIQLTKVKARIEIKK